MTYKSALAYQYLFFTAMLLLFGCVHREQPTNVSQSNETVALFPDYRSALIPSNIAPLNFRLENNPEACHALLQAESGETIEAFGKTQIRWDEESWSKLLMDNVGKQLQLSLSYKQKGKWFAEKPFPIDISSDTIDSHMVYRLIEPGYEKWHIVGIYQRDLRSFDERVIVRNDMTGYNCINCHSFCGGNPQQMLFHMRAENGGTYIIQNEKIQKLQTKTKETLSNLTYPYWHPSGKYVVASLNTIRQFFHALPGRKMEVFDEASDVVVYDIEKQSILSAASLNRKDAFETFPSFSPDGKHLYFCSAPAQKMPEAYEEVRYHLCRVAFDEQQGLIGTTIDTLVRADTISTTFPRISPDGRFLMYTETDYGQFPIWHKGADIRMIDLQTAKPIDTDILNSADTDSYHSWSRNSRWAVISSRRANGVYTYPYLVHIDEAGNPSKPFLLPQENPDSYDFRLYSYNLPELTQGEVTVAPYAIQHAAQNTEGIQVKYK